jgi:hypothetical protein
MNCIPRSPATSTRSMSTYISQTFRPCRPPSLTACGLALPLVASLKLLSLEADRIDSLREYLKTYVFIYINNFAATVTFVDIVLPGDDLTVDIRHTDMHHRNIVVKVVTSNSRGEKVLEGAAEYSLRFYKPRVSGTSNGYGFVQLVRRSSRCLGRFARCVRLVKDNQNEKTIHQRPTLHGHDIRYYG